MDHWRAGDVTEREQRSLVPCWCLLRSRHCRRSAGRRRSRGRFAAVTFKQPANDPTSIVGGGSSHA